MRNKLTPWLVLLLLASARAADTAPMPAKLDFPQAGFRISPLDLPPKDQHSSILEMSLPEDKDSASVGVDIHPNVKSLADYIAAEKKDLAAKHVTVLSEKTPSANEWVIEYSGGWIYFTHYHLHSYRRVLFANGKIYIALASAQDVRWPAVGAALKDCADSFALSPNPALASAAPSAATPAKLDFPNCGFRINALDAPANVGPGSHPARLTMRFSAGKSPISVYLYIEGYTKTMADFIAKRTKQGNHVDSKAAADSENSASANTFTYIGVQGDYNRAILAKGKIYLAVAYPENDKKSLGYNADYNAKLKACVDSLELIPSPPPAAPSL